MNKYELDYIELVDRVCHDGDIRQTRSGPTRSIFGTSLRIDSLRQHYFPILTQRKIFYQGVLGELAAFVRGATDLATFKGFGCNYWDMNAAAWPPNTGKEKDDMELGPIYGSQWRSFNGIDQLVDLLYSLRAIPDSRRHLLSTYNPYDLPDMCLPPCHLLAQFNVHDGELDCCVTMRSVDLMLGLPSDVVLYATLLIILAAHADLEPGSLIFQMGDTHIYENHVTTWSLQVERPIYNLPDYTLDKTGVLDFIPTNLRIHSYQNAGVLSYAFNV